MAVRKAGAGPSSLWGRQALGEGAISVIRSRRPESALGPDLGPDLGRFRRRSRQRRKPQNVERCGFRGMELAGLEPATSWVRLHSVQFAIVVFGLVEPNWSRPVRADSLSLVARVVARVYRGLSLRGQIAYVRLETILTQGTFIRKIRSHLCVAKTRT
jgi:hypothetical protein